MRRAILAAVLAAGCGPKAASPTYGPPTAVPPMPTEAGSHARASGPTAVPTRPTAATSPRPAAKPAAKVEDFDPRDYLAMAADNPLSAEEKWHGKRVRFQITLMEIRGDGEGVKASAGFGDTRGTGKTASVKQNLRVRFAKSEKELLLTKRWGDKVDIEATVAGFEDDSPEPFSFSDAVLTTIPDR